jgi:hypothetical protein
MEIMGRIFFIRQQLPKAITFIQLTLKWGPTLLRSSFLCENQFYIKKIPAGAARNSIGLHGRTLDFSQVLDPDGWMSKRAVGFALSTLQS